MPEGVAFYESDIGDSALLARFVEEQGTRAIMRFAGSIIMPELVADPLRGVDYAVKTIGLPAPLPPIDQKNGPPQRGRAIFVTKGRN